MIVVLSHSLITHVTSINNSMVDGLDLPPVLQYTKGDTSTAFVLKWPCVGLVSPLMNLSKFSAQDFECTLYKIQ